MVIVMLANTGFLGLALAVALLGIELAAPGDRRRLARERADVLHRRLPRGRALRRPAPGAAAC